MRYMSICHTKYDSKQDVGFEFFDIVLIPGEIYEIDEYTVYKNDKLIGVFINLDRYLYTREQIREMKIDKILLQNDYSI